MINWFFKKTPGWPGLQTGTLPQTKPDRPAATASDKTASKTQAKPPAKTAVKPKAHPPEAGLAALQAATGDDAALLQVAQSDVPLAVRLAAVQALTSEAALRQAEQIFRSHDRKVYQLAKQRFQTAVQQRQAQAQAQALLAQTQTLLADPLVPINHLVTLDRDWQALPANLLQAEQVEQFTVLRAELNHAVQARADAQQSQQRWLADAQSALTHWRDVVALAATQGCAADLDTLAPAVLALAERQRVLAAGAEVNPTPVDKMLSALAQTQQTAALVQTRLAVLETSPAEPVDVQAWTERWQALPGPAGLEDAKPLAALNARFEQALQQHQADNIPTPVLSPAPAHARARRPPATAAQREQLDSLLLHAETALAAGQLGLVQQHLLAIDTALQQADAAALPAALRARHQALLAERARLKGWQQWGGARARDDLLAQAQALAQATLAAVPVVVPVAVPVSVPTPVPSLPLPDDETPAPPQPPSRSKAPAKLNIKEHAAQIQSLRARWKELDRVTAADSPGSSQTHWHQFDAALHAAFAPVAAVQAQRQAARQDNLAAREALLADLATWPSPLPSEDPPPAWRDLLHALGGFQQTWRQLGPVEHTVPTKAQAGLQQRLAQELARLEGPLLQAQAQARERREALVTRAQALGSAESAPPDALQQVRDLQSEWQHVARQVPLPRGLENALWTRFKTATDAVFAQRDAAAAARQTQAAADAAAGQAQRDTALADALQHLQQLKSDLDNGQPVAQVERGLNAADVAWRQTAERLRGDGGAPVRSYGGTPVRGNGAAPIRGPGAAFEERWRAARAATAEHLAQHRRQAWQAECAALAAALALCEQREVAPADEAAGVVSQALAQQWADRPQSFHAAAWAQALAVRWAQPMRAGPLPPAGTDGLLLQLETAVGISSAPEWQDAKRLLKLQALKDTLEGRAPAQQGPGQARTWLLTALQQGRLTAAQRARLAGVVAALGQAPVGTLLGTG